MMLMTLYKSIKRLLFALLFLMSAVSNAEEIKDWKSLINKPKCDDGGGFFLWDSQRCLFDTGAIHIDGQSINVKRVETRVLRKKNASRDSIGDRFLEFYEGKNIHVFIQTELLPARCNYAEGQCTFRNMRARIRVERPGKPSKVFDAVGYSGS